MAQKARFHSKLTGWIVIMGLSCLFIACHPTPGPRPQSDSTPPTLSWQVYDHEAQQWTDYPANTDGVRVSMVDQITVTLIATDPGGIKRITLSGAGTYSCTNKTIESVSNMLYATQEHRYEPDSRDYVLTYATIDMTTTFNWPCDPGWAYMEGNAVFEGEAENYYGGITHAQINLLPSLSIANPTPTRTPYPYGPNSGTIGGPH